MLPSEPTILAFDTSVAHCAAALLSGGRIVAQRYEEMAKGQGERLIGLLGDVLDDHGAVWADLDGIGVGIGPGNFTGIRIAVSAARGLALGLGVPAIGVSGFEILHRASARTAESRHLISLPHRGGYYLQELLDGRHRGAAIAMTDPDVAPVLDDLTGTVILGENAHDIALLMAQADKPSAIYRDASVPWPKAAGLIAQITADRMATPQPRPAPLYIRAPDAAPPRDPAPVILP